jgi:hypothetical protein
MDLLAGDLTITDYPETEEINVKRKKYVIAFFPQRFLTIES